MSVIGITGAIGAGKSTLSDMLKKRGFPVFDADAQVHFLMENDFEMIKEFQRVFPDCVENNRINRRILALKTAQGLIDVHSLENIIYPFLIKLRDEFIRVNLTLYGDVVLDVPLLFESGWNEVCDKIIVVYALPEILKRRVMARPDMTVEKYERLTARQTGIDEKMKKADYLIDTSKSLEETENRLERIIKEISCAK